MSFCPCSEPDGLSTALLRLAATVTHEDSCASCPLPVSPGYVFFRHRTSENGKGVVKDQLKTSVPRPSAGVVQTAVETYRPSASWPASGFWAKLVSWVHETQCISIHAGAI